MCIYARHVSVKGLVRFSVRRQVGGAAVRQLQGCRRTGSSGVGEAGAPSRASPPRRGLGAGGPKFDRPRQCHSVAEKGQQSGVRGFLQSSGWDNFTSSLPAFRRVHSSGPGAEAPRPDTQQQQAPRRRQRDESSEVLNALVRAAAKVERWYDWARSSQVGRMVHPQQSHNGWGELEMASNVTDSVLHDVHAAAQHAGPSRPSGAQQHLLAAEELSRLAQGSERQVYKLCNNRERNLTVTEICVDTEEESGWMLLAKLLTTRRYLTTQQQATQHLFRAQPDFVESTFLNDVQLKLLPNFLNAFWSQDTERLKTICTPACYHVDVAPLLTQYALLQSRCRLQMVYDAVIFNRLMLVDDSEFAAFDSSSLGLPTPQPVLFVAVTAQLIDCWVSSSVTTKSRRMLPSDFNKVHRGDPYLSSDHVFVLGLIPEPRNRWVLTSFRSCRADALD